MSSRHTYRIHDTGSPEANSFKVVVSGDQKPEFITSGHATTEKSDSIYRNGAGNWTIHGTVQGDGVDNQDAFKYNGKRLRVVLEYPENTKVRVNDKPWKPVEKYDGDKLNKRTDWPSETGGGSNDTNNESDNPQDSNRGHLLVIEGRNGGTEYEVNAGTLSGTEANGGSLGWEDDVSGSSATGRVGGGRDAYEYWGTRNLNLDDPSKARVLLKPQGASSWKDITSQYRGGGGGGGGDSSSGGAEQPVADPGDISVPNLDDPVEVGGVRFKKRAHAVDDLGMDPNGGEDISARLKQAADDYTLIKFPEGDFRFANQTILEGYTNLGIVGEGKGTNIVAPRGMIERLIIRGGTGLRFANLRIDQSAPGACPGLYTAADDNLSVENIYWKGDGIHPNSTFDANSGNPEETNALSAGVTSENGTGVVRNFHLENGGQMRNRHTGNSRIGVWGMTTSTGTLEFVDCVVTECPNNGYYTSSAPGVIIIRGGRAQDNLVSQMRLATDGSYVKGCEIGYHADRSEARDPMTPNHGTQAVALDSGKVDDGAMVIDCDIHMAKCAKGRGGIAVWGRSGRHAIEDCNIQIDEAAKSYGGTAMPAIAIERPNGRHDNTDVTVNHVTISGSASSGKDVVAVGRTVRLTDVCASTGRSNNFKDCSPSTNNCDFSASSCPRRGSSGDGSSTPPSDDGGDSQPDQGGSDEPSRRVLEVTGQKGGGKKQFIFRLTDGDVWMTEKNEGPDYVEGPAAFGEVNRGLDRFEFVGEIEAFETIGGPIRVEVDGEEHDSWDLGEAVT